MPIRAAILPWARSTLNHSLSVLIILPSPVALAQLIEGHDHREDFKFKKLGGKKTVGALLGLLYMVGCLYAVFSIEATFTTEVSREWLITYSTSFAFDFLILRLLRCLLDLIIVIHLSDPSHTSRNTCVYISISKLVSDNLAIILKSN